jgi:hypothetical protein
MLLLLGTGRYAWSKVIIVIRLVHLHYSSGGRQIAAHDRFRQFTWARDSYCVACSARFCWCQFTDFSDPLAIVQVRGLLRRLHCTFAASTIHLKSINYGCVLISVETRRMRCAMQDCSPCKKNNVHASPQYCARSHQQPHTVIIFMFYPLHGLCRGGS